MTLLIGNHLLLPSVVTQHYPEKYNILSSEFLNADGQKVCNAFGQDCAPLTVMAEEGTFQKVLTAFVYPDPQDPKALSLSWVSGVTIPLDPTVYQVSFDVHDIGGQPTKVVVITVEDVSVAFPFKKENPLKGTGDKADKISSLGVGQYTLHSVKLVTTKFGDKALLTIAGKEYWANKQINELLSIQGLLPTSVGEVKVIDKEFKVVSKGTTASGHPYARVGFL